MTTFIQRLPYLGVGPRVAVKDAIDVAGTMTTAGSPAIAERATVAAVDADCVAAMKRGGAAIVGKVNLHELADGPTGINPWYGTPVNPLDPERIPGGSSSGSAVAVATGDAELALGTDTGGSVRIPAACCGVVGIKPTNGLISTRGVVPLAPSLDTVGLFGRRVEDVISGFRMLVPALHVPEPSPDWVIGCLVVDAEPECVGAVKRAVEATEYRSEEVSLETWVAAGHASRRILLGESARIHGHLLDGSPALGADVAERLSQGLGVTDDDLRAARGVGQQLVEELREAFTTLMVIALPTLPISPPTVRDAPEHALRLVELTRQANLAGFPAVAVPVPVPGSPIPASVQLIAPWGSEGILLSLARHMAASCQADAHVGELAGWDA